ncbi:MAG: TolC family protein [Bacteroidales bacterium]|nr:TolC family protein [Bacteroidales bacterium]
MNIKNLIVIVLFILGKQIVSFSQSDTITTPTDSIDISLSEAVVKGLERNYQIKISQKDVEIAQNNDAWGRAGRLPNINFSLNQNNRYDDTPAQTGDGRTQSNTNTLTPAVNLNWTLFNGFAIQTTKRNLEELRKISEESMQVQIENTILSIVLGYYDISLQQEKLKVLMDIMTLSQDRYAYVQSRKELGSAVTFDVLQVKDAFLRDSSNYILQKLNLDNAIRNFNKLMADTSYIVYNPTDEFKAALTEFSYKDIKDAMYSNNKTLKLQYLNQSLLENNIKLEKSSLYPSLSLNAGVDNLNRRYGIVGETSNTTSSYGAFAGVSLNYTIFNGWNRRKNIQNAQIEKEIGELQIKDLELSLNNQLLAIFDLYNARKQLYRVADENVKSQQLNLEIAKDKFNSGAINSFNYRDIQVSYIYASFDKLEAIYYLIASYNDLLRLTGGIIANY